MSKSFNKYFIFAPIALCLVVFTVLLFSLQLVNTNNSKAAGTNSADLVIGKKDTGNAIEVTACLKSTGDNIRLTDASTWFNFQNNQLTPSPTIMETGRFSSSNGYGPLKFQQVQPAPVQGQTSETWTMRVDFLGDGETPGLAGTQIQSAYPELVGKVKFDKIGSSANVITLTKSVYYTVEYATTPIDLTVKYLNNDCRDTDGDGFNDDSDSAPTNPCLPVATNCVTSSSSASNGQSSQATSSAVSSMNSSSAVSNSSAQVSSQSSVVSSIASSSLSSVASSTTSSMNSSSAVSNSSAQVSSQSSLASSTPSSNSSSVTSSMISSMISSMNSSSNTSVTNSSLGNSSAVSSALSSQAFSNSSTMSSSTSSQESVSSSPFILKDVNGQKVVDGDFIIDKPKVAQKESINLNFGVLRFSNGQIASNIPAKIRIVTATNKIIVLQTQTDAEGRVSVELTPPTIAFFSINVEAGTFTVIQGNLQDLNDSTGAYTAYLEIQDSTGSVFNANSITWEVVSSDAVVLSRTGGVQTGLIVIALLATLAYIYKKSKSKKLNF